MKNLLIFLISCPIVFNTACHHEENHAQEHDSRYLVTSPFLTDTSYTTEYVCQIHAIQHIEIRALEKGYLEKIFVDEGQFVTKGQPMFQIMPALYQAELQKAEAEVNFAEIEYMNTKNLADSNVVSENELALVKAKYNMAKADMALAQVHLDFTKIKAPFDGIMDRFHVRLGSVVEEGELLTVLSDNSQMWVYFNVPEAEYLEFKPKLKDSVIEVGMKLANGKTFSYPGVVETIVGDFNNSTGNIAFRATFPNPKGLLRHGETGNILMNIPLNEVLLIPQKATFEVLDKKYAYVVDEDHIIHARRFEVSQELPHIYVVEEGLDRNDKILLDGLRKVKDGSHISYDFIEPDSAISHLDLYAE